MTGVETMIARAAGPSASRTFYDWKRLRQDGWDVTVLHDRGNNTMLLLAARGGTQPDEPPPLRQLSLLA